MTYTDKATAALAELAAKAVMRLPWFGRQPKWEPPSGEYVSYYRSPDGLMQIENLNGIGWHDAPLPPKRHRCYPQTRAWQNFKPIFRCACGAIAMDDTTYWMRRNERRQSAGERL